MFEGNSKSMSLSMLLLSFSAAVQAVTLGEQRGFTLEQFARIVSCYLQDSDNVFRCVRECIVRVRARVCACQVMLFACLHVISEISSII